MLGGQCHIIGNRPLRSLSRVFVVAGLLVGLVPAGAAACTLSNQASLSANGYFAQTNLDGPSGRGRSYVPFLFPRVYGRGDAIHFSENFADLRKSLDAATLRHPFLWRWGDGTYSIATSPTHVYRRVGAYIILVYPYRPSAGDGSWAPFDQVQIRIVPPGEVWRDNLGQDFLGVLGFVMMWGFRLVLVVIAGILVVGYWEDARRWRRRRDRKGRQVEDDLDDAPLPLEATTANRA